MLMMFCFDPSNPIHNAIIEIVAASPHLAVSELHERLKSRKRTRITLQHLYRVINRLVEVQIILKEKGKLSLNRLWLGQIEIFAHIAAKNMENKEESKHRFPLKDGQSVLLVADSLTAVQALWYDTLVHLYEHLGKDEKEVAKYYSHAWWLVSESESAAAFFRRIAERGVKCYWLLGSDTYLDRAALQQYKDIFPIRIADRSVFPVEGYNLNVYGEYVLECIFPKLITKHLELLFSSISSKKQYDPALLKNIFDLKERYTIKLWRNGKLAAQLHAKITQFFDLRERLRLLTK